jgi:hypothetical protein
MNATASPPQEGQGFVTAKAIAKFYSVTEASVYRWASNGKIPALKFQGTLRFDFASVRAKIEGTEVKK